MCFGNWNLLVMCGSVQLQILQGFKKPFSTFNPLKVAQKQNVDGRNVRIVLTNVRNGWKRLKPTQMAQLSSNHDWIPQSLFKPTASSTHMRARALHTLHGSSTPTSCLKSNYHLLRQSRRRWVNVEEYYSDHHPRVPPATNITVWISRA